MPKRSRTQKASVKTLPRREKADPNQSAFGVLQQMFTKAGAEKKDPLAVALGRRGGLKGGRARADKLTAEQRTESARLAARARWKKRGQVP